MRKLDESKVYSLEDLTSDERNDLWIYLTKAYESWAGDIAKIQFFTSEYLYFCFDWVEKGEWLVSRNVDFIKGKQVTNAKELFYTLENVQVDCSELKEEQIKEMADVFEANGYKVDNDVMDVKKDYSYISFSFDSKDVWVTMFDECKHTITYSKFMELFAPQYEVTMIAEQPKGLTNDLAFIDYIENSNLEIAEENFKEITNAIANLLIYKNEKYGNSALNPLDIFNGKSKVGQRIDDKLARVKNSKELRKNDIADLLGYLTLVCQENNWTNFDEFKD